MSAAQKQFLEKGFGKHFPWLDVLNSQEWDGYGELTDYSADKEWQSYFVKHWGFSPAERSDFPLAAFRRLRALLRGMVEKSGAEQRVAKRDLNELNAAMKVPGTEKLIEIHNGFRTEMMPVRNDWNWMLGRI